MNSINYNDLSKIISHALRHQPSLYDLKLDKDGWVNVESLIIGIKKNMSYDNLCKKDIEEMIKSSKKKRHEIFENKIRASYGHSLNDKIKKEKTFPPKYLYHGTKDNTLNNIFKEGLLPMKRQYVHLFEKKDDAILVALRKTPVPTILRIQSKLANKKGVNFYKELNGLWLSDIIDSKYLEVDSDLV